MEHFKLAFSFEGKKIVISSHDQSWVEKKEKEYKEEITKILSSIISEPEKVDFTNLNRQEKNIQDINPSISVNEFYRTFLHETKITSRPEIATFFVYYLVRIKKQEEISPNDIKICFKDSGYPGWNKINISDVLSKAKKKAFLNFHNNQWSLTITGEDYVLNSMSAINEK